VAPLPLRREFCYKRTRLMRPVGMVYGLKVGDLDPLQFRSGMMSFLSFDFDVDLLSGIKGFS
jgi:hypothetical protein